VQPHSLLGGQVLFPHLGLYSVACPRPEPALPRPPSRDAVDEDVQARGGDGALGADAVEQEGPDAPADHTELLWSGRGRGVPRHGSQEPAMEASFVVGGARAGGQQWRRLARWCVVTGGRQALAVGGWRVVVGGRARGCGRGGAQELVGGDWWAGVRAGAWALTGARGGAGGWECAWW
jgi:hypothetical protein